MFIKKNFLNIFLKKILKKFWIYKFLVLNGFLKNFLKKIFGISPISYKKNFARKFLKISINSNMNLLD
jgi:hypothetical protein